MEGRKTILFLANGFGMEAKNSYSLGDDLIPTVMKLSQEYIFIILIKQKHIKHLMTQEF